MRFALILAPLLGVSTSTSALAADGFDIGAPNSAGLSSNSALWDSPATSPAVNSDAPSKSPVKRESGNPLWAIPFATLSDTHERPIFSPSRRPPPAVDSVSAPKAPPMPRSPPQVELRLSLVGTVSGGDRNLGIFVDQTSKATLRLKVGEDYQGWRLRSVHAREVTMARGELSETLKLPRPGEGAAAAGPTFAESAARRGSSHTQEYD
jgi:general secretion pathway protein N